MRPMSATADAIRLDITVTPQDTISHAGCG